MLRNELRNDYTIKYRQHIKMFMCNNVLLLLLLLFFIAFTLVVVSFRHIFLHFTHFHETRKYQSNKKIKF